MKKIVTLAMLTVLAAVSTLTAGAIRCEAMGNMTSLKDTRNFGTFPQLTLTGGESLVIGTGINAGTTGFGSVRYRMFDNMGLQVNVKTGDTKKNYDATPTDNHFSVSPSGNVSTTGFLIEAYNRADLLWSMDMGSGMLIGSGLKFYSNSSSDKSDNIDAEHSIWYMGLRPGVTLPMSGNDLDLAMEIGFGSWEGKSETTSSNTTTDNYKLNHFENDGWMDLTLNARYYMKGDKIDYVPFAAFNFNSAGKKGDMSTTASIKDSQSKMGFTLGSGIHLRPVEKINVFNELEFAYSNTTEKSEASDTGFSMENENSSSSFTLLPTYRAGVESIHNLDPKNNWLGCEQIKFWGGFSKAFNSKSTEDKSSMTVGPTTTSDDTESSIWSESSEVALTFGSAVSLSNMTWEFCYKYDETLATSSGKIDFVYNFKR